MTIRNYRGEDTDRIIEIWNSEMPYNKITEAMFVKNILLDLNFTPEGFFVAEENNEIIGFIYSTVRRIPVDVNGPMDEDRGWIVAIGVSGNVKAVGTELVKKAEEFINKDSKRKVFACSYTPNYFYQGINKRYPEYLELFFELGYVETETSIAMEMNLETYKSPEYIPELRKKLEAEGISFDKLSIPYIHSYLTFQKPSWTHRFRRLINEKGCLDNVNIAIYNGEVIGCNIFGDPYSTEERFGPFGVRDDFQGKGIGKILLDDCMLSMKKKGLKRAWMQWATAAEYVVNMYLKFGFEIMDTYVTFVKE